MVTIKSSNAIVYVEKQGNKFEGKTKATSMRKWLIGQISKYSKEQDLQTELILRGVLNAYNFYHPEVIETGEILGWKGKSGIININKLPDKVIITRMQKPNKNEEPKEVKIEISKEELYSVVRTINQLNVGDKIKTKVIAMAFSNILNLGHNNWKEFFADRHYHNLLTNILGFLDDERVIEYSGGVSTILDNKLSIQEILSLNN